MSTKRRYRDVRAAPFIAAILLGACTGLLSACGPASTPADSVAPIGGPFRLTRSDGTRFSDRDLAGKPFAIFFGFTRCPDVCPTTLSQMARVRQRLGERADDYNIVFVSVDPEHDSVEQLGRYVALFDTPVIGLTGTDQEIAAIARAYRVVYQRAPQPDGDYLINHTAAVYLMDAAGRFHSVITYGEDDAAAFTKISQLLSQQG